MAENSNLKILAIGFLGFGVWAVGTAVIKIALDVPAAGAAVLVAGVELAVSGAIAFKLRGSRPRPMPIHPDDPVPVEDPITKALHGGLDTSRSLADQTGFFKSPAISEDSSPDAGRIGLRKPAAPNHPKEDSTSGEPIRF